MAVIARFYRRVLRDVFAALAMHAILVNVRQSAAVTAWDAFDHADAMIAQRKSHPYQPVP